MWLNEKELRLVGDRDFFRAKAVITEKVKAMLIELRQRLTAELDPARYVAPEGVDWTTGQLVKGEHLDDFPYLYLDLPKFFSNEDKFAYRTLFWWGHHVVFALILEGRHLDRYKQRLMDHYGALANRGLYLLMTPTPWEWRRAPEAVIELTTANEAAVAEALGQRSFLKLHRFVNFDDPAVANGTLVDAALATFRLLAPIIQK
jgi:hypothetical protein